MSLSPGHLLNNRYTIERLLGQGGFGAVYKAHDANLDKPCAVKENLDTSQEAQRQFLREATVLANLSHPNLPRVTDHFIIPDQGQYLVMDFIEGEDLQHLVEKSGPLEPGRAAALISQVMDALAYMHSRVPPVLHRDIKPANIKLTPEGKAVLVDFGLVKLYDSHTKTTMGARAITPGYSPTEQYGQGSTDARTDVYALGATLYMLVTGINPPESVQRVAGDTLRPAHLVNPRVPPFMGMAIAHAMEMVPANRFQSMMEFKAALTGGQRVSPVQSAYIQPGMATQSVSPVAGVPTYPREDLLPPQVPYAPVKKKPKTGMIIGIVGGVIALAVIAVCIALYSIGNAVNKSSTATAEALAIEQTAQVRAATKTAKYEATQAAEMMQMTETALAYQLTSTAQAMGDQKLIFGPENGSLVHSNDGYIAGYSAGVYVQNFIVEATFFNPYDTSEGSWDYGFLFRDEGSNMQYRLIISSDTQWELYNNTGSSNGALIASGYLSNLDTSAYGANTIKLIAYYDAGQLWVNDVYISDLDLSSRVNYGEIYAATGMYTEDEIEGRTTDYYGFSVYELY
jgi:serine/threonine-protein kinase